MKIKMLSSFAGAWSCTAGEVVDRPNEEAARLIEAGHAVVVRDEVAETTAKRRTKSAS